MGIAWKRGSKRHNLINQCHILSNTWTIHIMTLAAFSPPLEGATNFTFAPDRATEVYDAETIRTKSQIFDIFQNFIRQAERHSNKMLKHLRIDFGKVFANHAFEEYNPRKVFCGSRVYFILPNKKEKQIILTTPWCLQFGLSWELSMLLVYCEMNRWKWLYISRIEALILKGFLFIVRPEHQAKC